MRYKGQKHSLKVAFPDNAAEDEMRATFNREYQRRYGHSNARAKLEFVALHSTAMLEIRRPQLAGLAGKAKNADGSSPRRRPVYFLEEGQYLDAAILNRYALPVGFKGAGPAIIEEYGSSTLVGPRDTFTMGSLGEVQIELGA